MTEREKIIEIIESNKLCVLDMDCNDCPYKDKLNKTYSCGSYKLADTLIEAGIGDVKAMKEIKYRVRRAEKALYIACRETAEIIFKDDFDRHAQEYMYGYLKQAENELTEEGKDG